MVQSDVQRLKLMTWGLIRWNGNGDNTRVSYLDRVSSSRGYRFSDKQITNMVKNNF